MNKITKVLFAAFSAFVIFGGLTQEVQAQGYDAIYDARCPVKRFPFGDDNVNQRDSVSKNYTSYAMQVRLSKPADRAGNNFAGMWLAWRKGGSHALERRDLTELGSGINLVQKIGINTLNTGANVTVNPRKIFEQFGAGKYFFYFAATTRDGETAGRFIYRLDIS